MSSAASVYKQEDLSFAPLQELCLLKVLDPDDLYVGIRDDLSREVAYASRKEDYRVHASSPLHSDDLVWLTKPNSTKIYLTNLYSQAGRH